MLIPLFNSFKFIGATTTPSKYPTASFVCRLDHSYIRQFLVLSCVLSLSRQFFGDAIVCMTDGARIPPDFVLYSCLINGTYTSEDGEIFYHGYYQWVSLYLLFVAFLFYAPYQSFSHYITRSVPVCHDRTDYDRLVAIVFDPACHRGAFLKTVAVEVFYLVVVLPCVAAFTNAFLNGKLATAPVDRLFPLEGTCKLDYFSGGTQTIGASFRCLLPVNVIHRLVFKIALPAFWIVVLVHLASVFQKILLYTFPFLRCTDVKNLDVWWVLRILESNTQGDHLWKLKKAFSIKSGGTGTRIKAMVSSL